MTQIRDSTDQRSRQQRFRELMERRRLETLLPRRSANFAWYTGGADNRVDYASPVEVADVLVTHDAEYVFTNYIEAPRTREGQTSDFEMIEHPWYGDEAAAVREVVGGAVLGTRR